MRQPHQPRGQQTSPTSRFTKGQRVSNTPTCKALTLHYGVVQNSTDEIIKCLQRSWAGISTRRSVQELCGFKYGRFSPKFPSVLGQLCTFMLPVVPKATITLCSSNLN